MKELINPLLWLLAILAATLAGLRFGGLWRHIVPWQKWGWRGAVGGLITFYLVATPVGRSILEVGLATAPDHSTSPVACNYIFVLGGGYEPGVDQGQDLLVQETRSRVLAGVAWWRKTRAADLVMAGASQNSMRTASRMVELMAADAVAQGVPSDRIILEWRSKNTREHPLRALELPSISRDSVVGIVTSNWHAWRAVREFRHHFKTVVSLPVSCAGGAIKPGDFMPDAHNLDENTTLLREYAAIVWYIVLDK